MIIDGLLSEKHLRPDQIKGNCNEVKTEDAVVSAVSNGIVDAGISSAARAAEAGLSFASLTRESHVLVIRKESLGDERICPSCTWFNPRNSGNPSRAGIQRPGLARSVALLL